jgi:hypothetical protein
MYDYSEEADSAHQRVTSQGEGAEGVSPDRDGDGSVIGERSPFSPELSRVEDLTSFFKMGPGGFSRNPETFAFIQLQKYLSNIKWKPVEGIRDRLYGFVPYSPKHLKGDKKGQPKTDMALDISFGSSGYALVLARAFKKVVSVNFHPLYLPSDGYTEDYQSSLSDLEELLSTLPASQPAMVALSSRNSLYVASMDNGVSGPGYTCCSGDVGTTVDYILVNQCASYLVTSSAILDNHPLNMSHHLPLCITI